MIFTSTTPLLIRRLAAGAMQRFPATIAGLVVALSIAAGPNHAADGDSPAGSGSRQWTLNSFRDFVEGTFDDSGVNAYVAADGSIRLINQWDLNNDGFIDIVLPNSHGHNEVVDLFIYRGEDNWEPSRRLTLPSDGGRAAAVADLNRDGWPDLVLINRFNGTKSELDLWIYWGGAAGFSAERRDALPTQAAESVALADLDGDLFPEIIVANSGLSYHVAIDTHRKSYVYWNNRGRFTASDRTDLPTIHAQDVATADLDGDGWSEIIFANQGNEEGEAGLRIYFNRRGRQFDVERPLLLPGERSSAVAAADLDRDGRVDLILANAFRLKAREGGIYNIIETTNLASYIYWNSAEGFQPARRTPLPTISAQDVAVGDLDGDGWPDITFAQAAGGASFVYWGSLNGFFPHRRLAVPGNNHVAVTAADLDDDGRTDLILARGKSPGSYDTDVSVYWGGPKGPRLDAALAVPSAGTGGVLVAKLTPNGKEDLVVVNTGDGPDASRTPTYIYWGDARGFDPHRRLDLPTDGSSAYLPVDLNADNFVDFFSAHHPPTIYWGGPAGPRTDNTTVLSPDFAFSGRAADFNRDGHLDLVVSEWAPGRDVTHVHYGGPDGFSPAFRTALPVRSARYHTIGDLNQDGWIDVIFPNFVGEEVVIFWNGPLGFDPAKQSRLPARATVNVEVADLNRDGFLDVIVPNLADKNPQPGKPRSFGGSVHGDTFVYWGGPSGYDPANRTVLPSVGTSDAAVADLDRNGHLDLVLSNYHAGDTRSDPSYIYWNGPGGFSPERHTRIPTHSASGALVADFNRDGWPDLLFSNHSREGNHRTDSWLYWGGPQGFAEDRRVSLPGLGPHFLTVVDIGHIADRGDRYGYVSAPHSVGSVARVERLTWEAESPFRTGIQLQVRAAESRDALDRALWMGPQGPGTYFRDRGGSMPPGVASGQWFQIRAELISPDSANTPILRNIVLEYRG